MVEPVGPLEAADRIGEPSDGTPIIVTKLDVRNVSGGNNTVEFAEAITNEVGGGRRGRKPIYHVPPGAVADADLS